jgi:hypothetical protein
MTNLLFIIFEILLLLFHQSELKHRRFDYKQFHHQGTGKFGNDFFPFKLLLEYVSKLFSFVRV